PGGDGGAPARREGGRQLGGLVGVVAAHLRHGVALGHDAGALAGAAGGLVAHVGDALDPPVVDELGDLRHEVVRVDLVGQLGDDEALAALDLLDRKSTRLNSSHVKISYAVFCLKNKKQ